MVRVLKDDVAESEPCEVTEARVLTAEPKSIAYNHGSTHIVLLITIAVLPSWYPDIFPKLRDYKAM